MFIFSGDNNLVCKIQHLTFVRHLKPVARLGKLAEKESFYYNKLRGKKMLTIESIKTALAPIAKEYGLKRIFLFGSYAKGCATAESDVDLLIEKGSGSFSLIKLSSFLQDVQDVLKLSVDVVTTSGIAADFKASIEGTEILVYEA